MGLIVSISAFAPALATAGGESFIEAVERARGEFPLWSRISLATAAGVVEREATDEERQRLLDGVHAVLSRPSEPTQEGDVGLGTDVGLGSLLINSPFPDCAPVATTLYALSPQSIPPLMKLRVGSGDVFAAAPCRGLSEGPYLEAWFDANPAVETCGNCARSSAQFWAAAPDGSTHVNDFLTAHHQGVGVAWEGESCFSWFCVRGAEFYGSHATVELASPPLGSPAPAIGVP